MFNFKNSDIIYILNKFNDGFKDDVKINIIDKDKGDELLLDTTNGWTDVLYHCYSSSVCISTRINLNRSVILHRQRSIEINYIKNSEVLSITSTFGTEWDVQSININSSEDELFQLSTLLNGDNYKLYSLVHDVVIKSGINMSFYLSVLKKPSKEFNIKDFDIMFDELKIIEQNH